MTLFSIKVLQNKAIHPLTFSDWQKDCLTRDEIKAGKNLVYTLPTSGGKTLVAEILIMKTMLCLKKNAVFVLPFVAIVQEKVSDTYRTSPRLLRFQKRNYFNNFKKNFF